MDSNTLLNYGDVVQLNPLTTRSKAFAGCLMIVTEPKQFGAQGYVPVLGEKLDVAGGQAYYRAAWDEMEYIGRSKWVAK